MYGVITGFHCNIKKISVGEEVVPDDVVINLSLYAHSRSH